ncbi:MAG: alpha/beta hydrolase [Leptospiraceae bacterium]|nr:alpha/beta hydrolase [Leptospiraceae bacterium]
MAVQIPGVELEQCVVRTSDGYCLSVRCAGNEEGTPIIFLHGFPEFWYGWRKQIPYFARRGYRVVVPDQRGYNDSDKPQEVFEYRLVQLGEDVAAIIRQLGLGQCAVVGHDWGAMAAWIAAIRHPSLIAKLVILNVPHPQAFLKTVLTNPMQFLKSWYIYFFQIPVLPAWLLLWDGGDMFARAMQATANPGSFTTEDLEAYKAAWQKEGALNTMIHWYRAAVRYPELPQPDDVIVPTLILWGKNDRFLEASMAEESLKYCRNGQLEYFPHATHWLQHDEPDAVNAAMERFISG